MKQFSQNGNFDYICTVRIITERRLEDFGEIYPDAKISMPKFPISKYAITPITDEATYKLFCGWAEEISDLEFEDNTESEKQFAYLDTLTLIETYESKNFKFNSIHLTTAEVIEQALDQLNFTKKDLTKILGSNSISEIFTGKNCQSHK